MKVLYVENHAHFASAVVKEFLSEFEVQVVPTIKEAMNVVANQNWDLALVDYDLDDGKGIEFVQFIVRSGFRIPVIACSSHERGNNEMLRAGAVAVCSKLEFKNIATVINNVDM